MSVRLEPFLARRLPPAREQTLSHRGIFILPSGFGLAWLVLTALLYLLGTNYQNNLIIGISLLLVSLFVSCIIYSYRNLEGLTLKRLTLPPIYAGETLAMPLQLSTQRDAHQIAMAYPGITPVYASANTTPTEVLIPIPTVKRGILTPGRLKVESRFPLGLMRTWTWVDLDIAHPVFAVHKMDTLIQTPQSEGDTHEQGSLVSGMDEYQGLKSYIPGESLKQVAWKQLAQGRGMLSKDFAMPQGAPRWLSLPGQMPEGREHWLSVLSYWVDELSSRQQIFGLRLPGIKIAPSSGDAHRLACQVAIATFDFAPVSLDAAGTEPEPGAKAQTQAQPHMEGHD